MFSMFRKIDYDKLAEAIFKKLGEDKIEEQIVYQLVTKLANQSFRLDPHFYMGGHFEQLVRAELTKALLEKYKKQVLNNITSEEIMKLAEQGIKEKVKELVD